MPLAIETQQGRNFMTELKQIWKVRGLTKPFFPSATTVTV